MGSECTARRYQYGRLRPLLKEKSGLRYWLGLATAQASKHGQGGHQIRKALPLHNNVSAQPLGCKLSILGQNRLDDAGMLRERRAHPVPNAKLEAVAAVYQKAGGKAYDMSNASVKKWQAIARDTAWKDFAAKSENCARLLRLAEKTL